MAKLWLRWLSRIPIIAIAVIAALALPWALSWLWHWLPKQWDVWIIVAITADAALVLLAGIWWLWWRLPRHQIARLTLKIRDPKARADTEDNFRKTVGQALGGAAVPSEPGVSLRRRKPARPGTAASLRWCAPRGSLPAR